MAVDYKKLDAALFAIEKYLYSVMENNGNYLDHAEFFQDMVRNLRQTVAVESTIDCETYSPEELESGMDRTVRGMVHNLSAINKNGRSGDKGKMNSRNRSKISRAMKLSWKKRKAKQKKVGR